jgi:catechol 2,3-dioxygenase-like lactoylglutathione lyase family enzyme
MHKPDMTLLYVASPPASARFYARLLQAEPVENSPGFAMFVLPGGFKLGLWKRDEVLPAVTAPPGAVELGLAVDSAAALDATHAAWQSDGIVIAQPPADMDFGRTFTALDPDGHRLRVYAMPQM